MFLSQLTLNPRHRQARRDLGDVQELHRTIMRAFPQAPDDTNAGPREHFGVLHRLEVWPRERTVSVLVQSQAEPDWRKLEDGYLACEPPQAKPIKDIYQQLRPGQLLSFRLRANPTKKIRPDGSKNGKRVPLIARPDPETGEFTCSTEELQIDWLARKGESGGFKLVELQTDPLIYDVRVVPEDDLTGSNKQLLKRKSFTSVLFDGHLRVVDPALMLRTITQGIGPAKAYGFGLLSIAPPRR